MSTPMTQAVDQFYRRGGFKNCHIFCVVMVTAFMILFPACGKKGPPIPPTFVSPPVVKELQGVLENNIMTLQWPVPEWEEKEDNALAGFYVYQSQIALSDTGCEDCPVRFKKRADVRIVNNKIDRSYAQRLEKGFRYSFKVSAYTDSGYEGETSETVTVDY